jgi:hypothetical protein
LDVDLGGRSLLGGFGYGGGLKVVIGVVIVVIVDERGGKEGVVKGAEDERRLLVMVLGGCHRFVVHLHLPLLLLGVALLLLLLTLLTCSSYRSRELTESGRDFGETGWRGLSVEVAVVFGSGWERRGGRRGGAEVPGVVELGEVREGHGIR